MSYGRSLRILIIEDEPDMIRAYKGTIQEIRDEEHLDIVSPVVAGGLEEARRKIAEACPFHLVILDLKLPDKPGGDAEASAESGLDLVPLLAARDHHPIPVLLILTGQPNYIQRISGFTQDLNDGFFKAIVERKGLDIKSPILAAIKEAQLYVDFGLCVTDPLQRPWPPLSPREEDLILRYGLDAPTHAGVELFWWAAEPKSKDGGHPDWTKVLLGHFWLKEHDMRSRSVFFKLESSANGVYSLAATKKMEKVLQHIQVLGSKTSSGRSLLVTAHATFTGNSPLSLAGFLQQPSEVVMGHLEGIVEDIAEQLDKLGSSTQEPKANRELLWRFHEPQLGIYDALYAAFSDDQTLKPSAVHAAIHLSTQQPWVQWRSCQHGDLHLGNISIDYSDDDARALLIDAGAMDPGPAGKDLAALEVAIVLHQASSKAYVLSSVVGLFNGVGEVEETSDETNANLQALPKTVRQKALNLTDEATYRLLLLDQALIQLGTLAYGSFGNKVKRPVDAIELYRALASWCVPELVGLAQPAAVETS